MKSLLTSGQTSGYCVGLQTSESSARPLSLAWLPQPLPLLPLSMYAFTRYTFIPHWQMKPFLQSCLLVWRILSAWLVEFVSRLPESESCLVSSFSAWLVGWPIMKGSSSSSAFPAMLDLQSGEQVEVRSLPQCLNRSPKLPVGIHRTGPCLTSQSIEGGAGLQDMVGVWGPAPHRHSSEWEIFCLWRWERSWQCPVLSLQIVTWAALSSWWMLSSSDPMSRWLLLLCSAGGCCPLLFQCLSVMKG